MLETQANNLDSLKPSQSQGFLRFTLADMIRMSATKRQKRVRKLRPGSENAVETLIAENFLVEVLESLLQAGLQPNQAQGSSRIGLCLGSSGAVQRPGAPSPDLPMLR